VAIDGRHPGYRNNRGLCLKALGRLDDAEADFRAAVDAAPGFADAARNLGHLRLQRGRLAEAAAGLSRALAAAPQRADLAASLHWMKPAALRLDGLDALETRLVASVRTHRDESPTAVTPFGALTLPLTPLELRAVAASHARLAERNAAACARMRGPPGRHAARGPSA